MAVDGSKAQSGVIFGTDLVRRGGVWVTRRDRSHDGLVKRATDVEFPAA